ncbi:hypothetical protein MOO46_06015 [Apilactobacillus apisilvae]|uniref:Uncharacterized protein n=1 Tax=Apilactobacillus apisilvae TaxID=2923364 RepID=A0ABY4PG71_9LACO|nr:hypothetical protein [Apilactobacillus apisilvae]UQS84799.1 hypothetical protein MOO46_06015 [Apilactobacillus apisilvae]
MMDSMFNKFKNMIKKEENKEDTKINKDSVRDIKATKMANQYRHIQENNMLRHQASKHNHVYSELNKNRMYKIALRDSLPKSMKQINSAHNN